MHAHPRGPPPAAGTLWAFATWPTIVGGTYRASLAIQARLGGPGMPGLYGMGCSSRGGATGCAWPRSGPCRGAATGQGPGGERSGPAFARSGRRRRQPLETACGEAPRGRSWRRPGTHARAGPLPRRHPQRRRPAWP